MPAKRAETRLSGLQAQTFLNRVLPPPNGTSEQGLSAAESAPDTPVPAGQEMYGWSSPLQTQPARWRRYKRQPAHPQTAFPENDSIPGLSPVVQTPSGFFGRADFGGFGGVVSVMNLNFSLSAFLSTSTFTVPPRFNSPNKISSASGFLIDS